ncbi:hypothetical protein GQ457_06G015250 [Hibiscus cannabinus]
MFQLQFGCYLRGVRAVYCSLFQLPLHAICSCCSAFLFTSHLFAMDSDLLCAMESLHFTEEEAAAVAEIPDENCDSSLWLVGNIISCKQFDGDSIIRIFRSVWKTKNILEMVELQPNFFLIKPSSPGAKDMILKRRPWTVHNDFFSIKSYVPAFATTEYVFHFMTIWVRVYKLPLRAMNRDMGLRLGGTVGTALGVDHRVEGGNMGEFLRILVEVDTRKPLRRCFLLHNGLAKQASPCPLRYERLPDFCYFCGLVGHVLASCPTKSAADDGKKLQYGSWLRVSTQQPRPRKRMGIEYFAASNSAPTVPASVDAVCSHFSPSSSCPPDDLSTAGVATGDGVPAGVTVMGEELPTVFPIVAEIPIAANVTNVGAEVVFVSIAGAHEGAPGPQADSVASLGSTAAASKSAPSSRTNLVVVDSGLSIPADPSIAAPAVVLQQSASSQSAAMVLTYSTLSDPPLALQSARTDGSLPLVVRQPTALTVATTTPIRVSKRALQGNYELKLFDGGCRGYRATPSSVMKILCWNCRGLGSSATIQSLGSFIAQHDSGLIFLSETRLKQSSSSRIQHTLNMNGCFVVDSGNGCTGLMLLWNKNITVSLLSYPSIHIDVNVTVVSGSFHFSGFHGHCVDKNKHLTWSTIDRLSSSSTLPWIVGGDFNEILCHSEKEGGRRKLPGFLDTFRDCVDRNHLVDCKPISGWFTWLYTNSVSGTVIQERLDRYLATTEWFTLFPEYRVSSFYTAKLDHCFLLMDTTSVRVSVKGGFRDYFRFDSCWSKEEVCIEKVRSSWLHSSGPTVSRLQAIGDSLRSWQADRRVSSTKRMSDLQGFLNSCMQGTITDETKLAFLEAKREHKSLLDKDEAYWAQRARVAWVTHGDRNTAYFHARASGRRKQNRIRGLFDESGIWKDKQAEVVGVAVCYFSTLFSSSQPSPHSTLLSNIVPCISSDHNSSLLHPFTDVEILAAFQDINPMKAPGIDGLPGSFFRQHWELIGPDILWLCHDLLTRKVDMSCVNATVITLIPKVADPVRMQQLRPISLCTVVYKIVSKTILNRMKPYLPGCISENQSAFLKGRLISDNILVAHELIHYLCSSKNGPNKGAALKLDMEKAFDRVEWTFLRSVLLRMGFHSDWVTLIMDCVSTVTFRVRINGRLSPVIIPQRGLRQGDPLSPFLFVICMQGLSTTLLAEQEAGRIMGIRASQKGPRVNHLLYADDCIVFIRNSEREATRLKEVLRLFADSSGQRINFGKSTVFYSPSTPSADRHRISAILGIAEVFDPGIYLGVPLRVGKNKTNRFGFLNEKVDDRISGWTKRLLSFGGREIFLKSVAQALPLYIMSCYLLPRSITDRITSSMRRYWWSGQLSVRGWPLLAWDKICTPKNAGGLGLRDLRRFNLALIGKQLWRFLIFPDSLVARVFRAKYYRSRSLLDPGLPDHASYAWKGLHSALVAFRDGFLPFPDSRPTRTFFEVSRVQHKTTSRRSR